MRTNEIRSPLDELSVVQHLFRFLDARGFAQVEQCCRSFKVMVPQAARQRERLLQIRWRERRGAGNVKPSVGSVDQLPMPESLRLIDIKSRGAWGDGSGSFKGWTETLHIQEHLHHLKETGRVASYTGD